MSVIPCPPRRSHSPSRKIQERKDQEHKALSDQILHDGAQAKAAAAAAALINRATLTEAEIRAWQEDLGARLDKIQQHSEQTLGFIEEELARATREPLRLWAERAAQAKANATPCLCPGCRTQLSRQQFLRRSIQSRFGLLDIYRYYGWCGSCEQWHFPADHVLGLGRNAPASPYVQEMAALLTAKMPPEQAVSVAERMGLEISRCFLHREAHRQGIKAEAIRVKNLAQFDTWDGLQGLAAQTREPSVEPFTLVIEIDAWNIRERDHWGETAAWRKKGDPLSRWHWVYMGTVFRLNHRGETDGGRSFISQRGYASTRLGIEALMRQLHLQAVYSGLGQARDVLVIADGAVWIWNAAKDRFPAARSRLDLYHAEEHLWEVANELYGKGTPEARQWVEPVLKRLRKDDHLGVIQSLKELTHGLKEALQKKVNTQVDYFENNKNRMGYHQIIKARKAVERGNATAEQKAKACEPLGSGAVESTCRQYQCRFKRTGQFWSLEGDEALMCLETLWRNGRWHLLFPHSKPPSLTHN